MVEALFNASIRWDFDPREPALTRDTTVSSTPPAYGRFRVVHQVGAGVHGSVFLATDPEGDRQVAIKTFPLDITPERAASLAAALRQLVSTPLGHPSIVPLLDAGSEGSTVYLAQEYVLAESVDTAVREYGPAPVPDALRLIGQLAGALDFAAVAGVHHGALHPRDVLVAPNEVRLTGIGVAEAFEQIGLHVAARRPYSAPERHDRLAWGTPADVFSLAAVGFEMLTGRRPGSAEALAAETRSIPSADRTALAEVFARALSARPGERYQTALAFAAALRHALTGEPIDLPQVAPPLETVAPPEVAGPPEIVTAPDDVAPPEVVTAPDDVAPPEVASAVVVAPPDPVEAGDSPELMPEAKWGEAPPEAQAALAPELAVFTPEEKQPAATEAIEEMAEPAEIEETAEIDEPAATEAIVAFEQTGQIEAIEAIEEMEKTERIDEFRPAELLPEVEEHPAGPMELGEAPPLAPPPVRPVVPPPPVPSSPPWRGDAGTAPRRWRFPLSSLFAMLLLGIVAGFVAGYSVARGESNVPNGGPVEPQVARPEPSAGAPPRVEAPAADPLQAPATSPAQPPERGVPVEARTAPPRTRATPERRPAPAAADRGDESDGPFEAPLAVISRPAGALVRLDGRAVGKTPLRLSAIRAGAHVVRLELNGYLPWSSAIQVVSGTQNRVTASLERRPGSIE